MTSVLPDRYRAVSVATIQGPLTEASLRAVLLGRPAYRRTVFVVARSDTDTALAQVQRADPGPLFSPITDLTLLAGPDQTAYLHCPDLDVGLPSGLAQAARDLAPQARCVVVEGRYRHVSFILDPRPVRVRVLDVVPPEPAKLVDQVRRVLDVAEDLAPVQMVPVVVDLAGLAAQARDAAGAPPAHFLFPCRGGGMAVGGAEVSYLDEVPPQADWTLLGCARSQAIHQFFYGRSAPAVDTCPKTLAASLPGADAAAEPAAGGVLLTKCCLRETGIGLEDGMVVVPWGASMAEILNGLRLAVQVAGQAQRQTVEQQVEQQVGESG